MIAWWAWVSAAALYAVFRFYYDNRGGRLTPAEIDHYMAEGASHGADAVNDLGIVRGFLEQDDGREFVMVNLVRLQPGLVPHPDTGVPTPATELMQLYSKTFVKGLIRYGGHPAIATRKVGGYVDAWLVPPDPGWNIVGFMRYRSRRDMIRMATDPGFKDIHKFKIAAVAETFSFPTQPFLRLYVGPRVWVGLLLVQGASVAQIIALLGQ
jgi:hypothetical protein